MKDYPYTEYEPLVQTMLTKFNLAVFYLNSTIENLYQRIGHDESAQFINKDFKKVNFISKVLSNLSFLGIEVYLKDFNKQGK